MQVLIGRIATEGKVNTVKGDKQVVNFSIALNNNYRTKEGEKRENTTFVNCAYWRSTGIADYLKKGTLVEVSGHLTANAYTDSTGKPKASINFHTSEITLHGKAKAEEPASKNNKEKRKGGRKTAQTPTEAEAVTEPADDLPF